MKKDIYVLLLAASLFLSAAGLISAQETGLDYLSADSFLSHVAESAYDYIGNEEKLHQYRESYLQSRSVLYPQLRASLENGMSDTLYDFSKSTGFKTENQKGNSVAPKISASQILPTAGVLNGEVKDTLSYIDPGTVAGFSPDPYWANKIDVSVNLSQPIYFRNAYKASVDLLAKSSQSNTLTYRQNKNALFIQALRDFYSLKQALYNRLLIENRLEADRASYARVEKEYSMGLWTKSVFVNAKASLLKSESDYLRQKNTFQESRVSFASIYNLKALPEVTPVVDELAFDSVTLADYEKALAAHNPSLAMLSNQIAMLDSQLIIYEKDNAPVLSAGISYSTTTPVKKGENENRAVSGFAGVSVRVSDGGKYAHEREGKLSEIEGARNSLLISKERILGQGRSLFLSLELCAKNKEYYSVLVESASYEYEKGILDRELGQITDKTLTELKLGLENARLALQQNIIEKNTAYLDLLNLMGEDLFVRLAAAEGTEIKGTKDE